MGPKGTSDDIFHKYPPMSELKQLWNNLWKNEKKMTSRLSEWITDYLQILEKQDLYAIIKDVSRCLTVEKEALLLIEKWLIYQTDEHLKFFAHYAALQLFIEGSNIPDLANIIIEIFDKDKRFNLVSLAKRLFNPRVVNKVALRQILGLLHQNIRYSSKIDVWINQKDVFDLILDLELERIKSYVRQSFETPNKSFLLMIEGCSLDIRLYLLRDLRTFINEQSEIQSSIKDEYVAVVIKWIIEHSMWNDNGANFSQELYDYIFSLLHDQRFPLVQKTIINALNWMPINSSIYEKNMFLNDNAIINLENIVQSWRLYQLAVTDLCLLAYGNCLLKLEKCRRRWNVSNEIQSILTNLFDTSSSNTTSIRAGFCLILAQYPSPTFSTITNWFGKKWNLTSEKNYNVLLQHTLYKWNCDACAEDKVADFIEERSSELLNTFVLDLYNCLYKNSRNNYLADPTPNYTYIAEKFTENEFDLFQEAIQKSSFGEEKFQRELCHSLFHAKDGFECVRLVRLYSRFGVLTVEFIDMLEYVNEKADYEIWSCVENINQVSSREVIENLFTKLVCNGYTTEFNIDEGVLELLIRLAKGNIVSFLEVHRRVSHLIKSLSDDIGTIDWDLSKEIFDTLLSCSCIEQINVSGNEE